MEDDKYIEMETNTGENKAKRELDFSDKVFYTVVIPVIGLIMMLGIARIGNWVSDLVTDERAMEVVQAVKTQYERNCAFGLQSDESTYNILVVNKYRESIEEGPYSFTGESLADLDRFNFIGTSKHELVIIGDTDVNRTKGYATELEFIENVARMAYSGAGIKLVEKSTEQTGDGINLNKYVFNIPSKAKYIEAYEQTSKEAGKIAELAIEGMGDRFLSAEIRVYFTDEFDNFEAILVYTLSSEEAVETDSEAPQKDTKIVNNFELLGWDLWEQTTVDDWALGDFWYDRKRPTDAGKAQLEYSELVEAIGKSMTKTEQ